MADNKPQPTRNITDVELMNQLRALDPDTPFTGFPKINTMSGVIPNKEEFDRLNVPVGLTSDFDTAIRSLADAQSFGEQAWNTFAGGGKLTLAGIIDYLATWDLSQGWDAISENQREYGDNFLHEWASAIRNDVQENNPLYQQNPGKVDFTDFAWLGNQLQQLGYSAGMIVAMLGESAALNAVTAGTAGTAKGLATVSKLPTMLQKVRALYSTTGTLAKAKNLGYGLFSGYREAELNMAHTYDEIKEQYLADGYSLQEAQMYAAEGAAISFQTELIPNMLSNMAQFAVMGYNPTTRQFTNSIEKGVENLIKNKYLRGTVLGTGQALTEGAEEVWQGAASQKGKEYADYLAGKRGNYSFFSDEYLGTHDMWNEFIGGLLGGTVFNAIGTVHNKFQQRGQEKAFQSSVSNMQNEINARRINNFEKIKLARENGQENIARQLEEDNNFYGAMAAIHTDYVNDGRTNLFQSYIDMLEGALSAAQEGNVADVQKFFPGLNVDLEMLAEKLPEYLNDAKRIQQLYNLEISSQQSSDAIVPIVFREFQIEKNNKTLSDINSKLAEVEGQLPHFDQLSSNGKTLYRGREILRAQTFTLESLKADLKKEKDSDTRESLEQSIQALQSQIGMIESSLNSVDLYGDDTVTKERDRQLLMSIGENRNYFDLQQIKSNIEADNEVMMNDLSKWKDRYYQSDIVQRAIQNDFDAITDERGLKEFEVQMNKKDLMTKEWRDRLAQKKRIIDKNNKKKTDPTPVQEKTTEQKVSEELDKKKQEKQKQKDDLIDLTVPKQEEQEGSVEEEDVTAQIQDIVDRLDQGLLMTLDQQQIYADNKDFIDSLRKPQTAQETNPSENTDEIEEAKKKHIKLESAGLSLQDKLNQFRQQNATPDAVNANSVDENGNLRTKTVDQAKDDLIDAALEIDDEDSIIISQQDKDNYALKINNSEMLADPQTVAIIEDFYSSADDFVSAITNGILDKDVRQREYDFLKEAYKLVHERLNLPALSEAEFDRIYRNMFDTLQDKANRLIALRPKYEYDDEIASDEQKNEREIDKNRSEGKVNPSTPIYIGTKVNESTPKLAHSFLETRQTQVSPGVWKRRVVGKRNFSADPFMDSTPLLNFEKYQPGTQLIAKVPIDNLYDIPIYVWNRDNSKINQMSLNGRRVPANTDLNQPIDHLPFGEALAKYPQIAENEELYNEHVPILIYDPRLPDGSKAISALHNVDWWNITNVHENDAETNAQVAKEGAEKTKAQRQAIINNGNQATIRITLHGESKTDVMYDELGEIIYTSINEQNPDVQLAIYQANGFNTGRSLIDEKYITNPRFTRHEGGAYYMIPVGKHTDGHTLYEFAQAYTNNTKLLPEISESIFNTIQAYVTNLIVPDAALDKQLREMRITDNDGLRKYINQFLKPLPKDVDGMSEIEVHNWLEASDLPQGEIYFRIGGNNITMFKVKEALAKYNKSNPDGTSTPVSVSYISIPTQIKKNEKGKGATPQMAEGFLRNFLKNRTDEYNILDVQNTTIDHPIKLNLDRERLASTAPVYVMKRSRNEQGRVTFATEQLQSSQGISNYASIMKDMFTTNLLGIQATDGSYHSASQAVINYELSNQALNSEIVRLDQKQTPNPVFEEVPEINQLQENENQLTSEQQDFLNTIQEDFWIENELRNPGVTLQFARQIFPNSFSQYFNEDGTLKRTSDGFNNAFVIRLTQNDVDNLTKNRIRIQGVNKFQINSIVNFLSGNIMNDFRNALGQQINKRELYIALEKKANEILDAQSRKLQLNIDSMTKFGINTNTQTFVDNYTTELEAIKNIQSNMTRIINYTMDSVQQELNIKQVDRQYKKGDVVMNFEISPEYQNLFNLDSPIEFIEYNNNDTIRVKQGEIETNVKLNSIDELLEFNQDENTDDFSDLIQDVYNDGQVEKNQSKMAIEQDPKQAMNTKVKMLLRTLELRDNQNKPVLGAFNLPQYNTIDNTWKKLQAILTNNNLTEDVTIYVNNQTDARQGRTLMLTSNYDDIVSKLKAVSKNNPWINQLIDRLQDSPESVKNAFCYDMYKHAISMCKVHLSYNADRNNTVTILDANSNEIIRVIRNNWRSILANQSPLTLNIGNRKSYNLTVINDLINRFTALKNNSVLDTFVNVTDMSSLDGNQQQFLSDLRKWLGDMGLVVTPETIGQLVVKGLAKDKSERQFGYSTFKQLFGETTSRGKTNPIVNSFLFDALNDRLLELQKLTELQNSDVTDTANQIDYSNQEYNQLYYKLGGMLLRLAKIEAQFTKTVITTTHNEGGKNTNDITMFNFLTQFSEELKADYEGLRAKKLGFVYDGNSFDLQLLETESYQSQMLMRYMSPEALTQHGINIHKENKVPTLADVDYDFVKLAGLMYTKTGLITLPTDLSDKFPNISFRLGHILNPTSSDKEQVFMWKKAIIDFKLRDFIQDEDGNIIGVQQDIINFFRSQVVIPELARIIDHHKKARDMNVHPNNLYNHDGYNYGAQHFSMIPALNSITVLTDGTKLVEYLATLSDDATVDSVLSEVGEQVDEILNAVIEEDVLKKLEAWKKDGYFYENQKGETVIEMLDLNYFNGKERKGNNLKNISGANKMKALAYDFVINNMISNANYFMMYAGDIANYSLNKHYKKEFFEKAEDGQPLIYKPKEEYQDMIFNYMTINGQIDTNLGKRLAAMIAPRNAIANSQNDKYNQIVVLDQGTFASNLDYLIELYYGKELLSQAQPLLDELNTTRDEKILKKLSKMFPYLSSYMDITSTDGQEYTTWQEHLDTIMRQGRLDDEVYAQAKDIYTKLSEGKTLNDKELKFVFQPNKPVYTGHNVDDGYTKMVYVKTSSFPLLPQFTKAFPNGIDKVRQYMEGIQNKSGKNTRLVYVSGIKAGLPVNGKIPALWNADGTFNEELNNIDFAEHSLVLDRKYWGIQQDTPYKSGYKKEDKVSIGTQMMKMLPTLLFDVMTDGSNTQFNIDGSTYNGEELFNRMNDIYSNWISTARESLYNELDIDPETNTPRNLETFMKKMNNLLVSEAKQRGYSPQDIDSLKLKAIRDKVGGEIVDIQFSLPLYFTPNSNKYEGLLNSIISNRMIDLKMPGNAYIVASEEGWLQGELGDKIKSDMIFTKNWTGRLLPQREVDGKVLPAQVICSPKFRMADGSMLDLLTKKDGQYVYIEETDNGFRLKEDMIDSELLQLNSFRIPYSGPQSGPTVEIVGFFSGEKYGDLMIVPKNHVTQIGEDFDVDKRYTYQIWNFVDTDGKVKKLEKKFGENIKADQIKTILDSAKKYIDVFNSYKTELNEARDMGDVQMVKSIQSAIEGLIEDVAVDADLVGIAGIENRIRNIVYNYSYAEKLYSKLLQNELIKVYTAISLSNSPTIQREMNKVLSTDESEIQGTILEKLRQQDVDITMGTLLSDSYQKRKMQSGATAKLGIAIYSNALVLHNMIQQATYSSKQPVILQNIVKIEDENGNIKTEVQPLTIQFGNIETDGKLGKKFPVKPIGINEETWTNTRRSIGDIFNELQNVSTDNEKLQLYGKLGLNEITTNVDVIMTMLGIKYDFITLEGETEKTQISLPHFLISQPMIQEFVTRLQNKQSNLADFDIQAEQTVLSELLAENESRQAIWDEISDNPNMFWKNLTGQELYEQLSIEENDDIQLAALHFFLQMKDHMFVLSKTYSQLNIQSTALGRSIFDVQNIEEGFANFIGEEISDRRVNKSILNINKLVGEFRTQEEYDSLPTEEATKYQWYSSANYWFKPTTVNGNMLYNSITAHKHLFEKFYPFASEEFDRVFQQVLDNLGYQEMSKSKKVRLKEKAFQEMKKYLFSMDRFGLYSGNIQSERFRLLKDYRDKKDTLIQENVNVQVFGGAVGAQTLLGFLDYQFGENGTEAINKKQPDYVLKKENDVYNLYKREDVMAKLSLASYLEKITSLDSPSATWIKGNFLIQDFTYDVNVNQGASFMRYRTVSEKNYDQEDIYNAIIDLMEKNVVLDTVDGWNDGNPYTSRDLAEDLITHAYINQGGVQSAIEYVKNIPVAVLERISDGKTSFAQKLRIIQDMYVPKFEINNQGLEVRASQPQIYSDFGFRDENTSSNVLRQIVQNNPSWGKKITPKDYINARRVLPSDQLIDMGITSSENIIKMKDGKDTGLQFVVEYNRKAKNETGKPYKVYERILDGVYREIPTLGNAYIHEYDPNTPYIQSIMGEKKSVPQQTIKPVIQTKEVVPNILPFSVDTLDSGIILQSIADSSSGLAPLASKLLELEAFKKPLNVVLGEKWAYNITDDTVMLNQIDLTTNTSQNLIASRIMEEMLHALITPSLKEHFNAGTTDATVYRNVENVPDYISTLGSLYLQANKAVKELLLRDYPKNPNLYNTSYAKVQQAITELNATGQQTIELNDVDDLVYSVSDIFEFTARLLSNPNLISKLGNIKYSNANKTILDRFKEVIQKFLYSLGLKVDDSSIAAQGINQMFEYLETLGKENKTAIPDSFDNGQTQQRVQSLSNEVDNLITERPVEAGNESGITDMNEEARRLLEQLRQSKTDDLFGNAIPLNQDEINTLNQQREEDC